MLSRFTHDLIATPLKSSVVFSSSVPASSSRTSCSSAITRLSNEAGVSTLAIHAATNPAPCEGRIDHASSASRTYTPKKSKSAEARRGKYERPATYFKPVNFHHRLIDAFAKARASFDNNIDYVLWDLKTAAPGMTLSKTARSNLAPAANEAQLRRRKFSPSSSLEERTAAAIAKLVQLGHVNKARKVLQASNQLRTRFSPDSLAVVARAVAKVPPGSPPPAERSANSSLRSSPPPSPSTYPTTETIKPSSKWLLWELRPQLYDAAKRKQRDAAYQSSLTNAIEEFMWCSSILRDWTGVLETFDGTAMNMRGPRGGGGLPSVKMCQLAMQAVFARHYYDAPGKGKDKAITMDEGRGASRANLMKKGYTWTEPSVHTELFRKIAAMVEVMRKSGVDPLYPEVHAILLRELGRLVSSGKTLTSVKLVEDWLVYYEAAMAVRVPLQNSTSTPSEPSSSSSPPPQSHLPASIILAAAEAIVNILEEAKNQLGYRWTKAGQMAVARQKHEYLENTLQRAFDEVMGHFEGLSLQAPLAETIDQHAKTQSVIIRRHLLYNDVRAAWGVWTKLVEDVEEAAKPKESQVHEGNRSSDHQRRARPSVPPTTSLRLDSAYFRILHTARRLNDFEFISTTALPLSSRILVGRDPSRFVDIWRETLQTLVRQSPTAEERLRLLGALKTLDKVLEEREVGTSVSTSTQLGGGQERSDVMRGVFTGDLVNAVRIWWSASDLTAGSTKEIGEMFEKFGVILKVPLKKRLSSPNSSDVTIPGAPSIVVAPPFRVSARSATYFPFPSTSNWRHLS